jgi:hypothetical protein
VRAVGGIDDPALQSALDKLADADLLIAEGAGHEANYRFKHALIVNRRRTLPPDRSKIDPRMEASSDGSDRPGEAGRGCAARASAEL